jgi:hypothetical protein
LTGARLAHVLGAAPRGSKYRNRKTVVDGIVFASAKEARRYGELLLLQRAGEISDLWLQPRFPLVVNGIKICTYVADFAFKDKGVKVVEDSKGVETPVFKIKRKLMKACLGIEVLVT